MDSKQDKSLTLPPFFTKPKPVVSSKDGPSDIPFQDDRNYEKQTKEDSLNFIYLKIPIFGYFIFPQDEYMFLFPLTWHTTLTSQLISQQRQRSCFDVAHWLSLVKAFTLLRIEKKGSDTTQHSITRFPGQHRRQEGLSLTGNTRIAYGVLIASSAGALLSTVSTFTQHNLSMEPSDFGDRKISPFSNYVGKAKM